MSSRRRSSSAAPLEDENLLPEILLRLPPQPSSLPRASLVCKRWRSVASDPGFLRRFRIHHRRSPPLLGCFVQDDEHHAISFLPTSEPPNRVPPGRFSLQFKPGSRFTLLDCRHGLVLVVMSHEMRHQFVVWDPVTGDKRILSYPPGFDPRTTLVNGAVLRAAGDAQHFQVVFLAARNYGIASAVACVYSSETGVWGNLVSVPISSESERGSAFDQILSVIAVSRQPAVLVGDSIYWILTCSSGILEFNFEMQSLAVIPMPNVNRDHFIKFIRADSGGLGFLDMSSFTVQLWERTTDCNGVAPWRLRRTIELAKLLPLNPKKDNIMIEAFAEENNMVFLSTLNNIYVLHLQSLELKKIPKTDSRSRYHPYESVYNADNLDLSCHDHF
ncbi:putative F-box protein [Hordeum vulgare]|nr:putative F-box protein [Hordeum vulgare]